MVHNTNARNAHGSQGLYARVWYTYPPIVEFFVEEDRMKGPSPNIPEIYFNIIYKGFGESYRNNI